MTLPNPNPSDDDSFGATPNGAERRRHPRLRYEATVDFLNMGDDPLVPVYHDLVSGTTEDISTGGMRVRVPYAVKEGSEVGVIVRKEDRFKVFLARVVWKVRSGAEYLYGLSVPKLDIAHLR